MEFIIVPIIFGLALVFLSIGKFFGREGIKEGCKSSESSNGSGGCSTCSVDNKVDDSGLDKISQLGNPNRKKRYIDKLDFKPEKIH